MSNIIQRIERRLYNNRKRHNLFNKTPSIICCNCNAGIIYHDLGVKFFSPTINLYINPGDYLKILKNMDLYFYKTEFSCENDTGNNWPVGKLSDVLIHFQHYKSYEEGVLKWNERKFRINFDNLFIIMTDQNGCTYEQIAEFDSLPYKNKVIFTKKAYPEFASAFAFEEFADKESVGVLSDFRPDRFFRRRYLDDFDYVKFLNTGDWK